jgi:DNA primase
MNFSKDFPEKLRSSILISEVIGKKVRLKKQGKNFLGLCPFHNEKSPSFTVNDQKGFYHCFGCQAHGDVITFAMENERLEFKEAIFKLADDFGIQVPLVASSQIQQNYVARDFEIIEKINQFFEKNLYQENAVEARNYLKKRGFNSVIAKKFHIGYALNSYEGLLNHLRNLGFSD